MLSEIEITGTLEKVEALRSTLVSKDKNLILKHNEELNTFTAPFAERVMDLAISHAMKGKQI